jgi:hypothetical protein
LKYDGDLYHLQDWERDYVKQLITELMPTNPML